MTLEMFQYIEDVLMHLEDIKIELDIANREIEEFFDNMLDGSNDGFLNINSRVKSKQSLKEKILRYDYFSRYQTVEGLFENLSDLIGIRLECRFIGDEIALYKLIRKYFSVPSDTYKGFFYHQASPNILLELESKQPKSQKNGVKMYRIDGKYLSQGMCINFEVQIKSLVNIFWSEIEHKVIYKNYNYIIADRFYKDIMSSIKNSLTTIDQQLLLISNQFDRGDATSNNGRKAQLQKLLSKVMYDLFALKIKSSIGILVDFRKSCDTIVKYVFRNVLDGDEMDYHTTVVGAFSRLNQIENTEVAFTEPIVFERNCVYEDKFTETIGDFIQGIINTQFQWTLFFKILFQVEPESNVLDFEKFIVFYRDRFYKGIHIETLKAQMDEETAKVIVDQLMLQFAKAFMEMNTVEALYDNMIDQIIRIFNNVIDTISRNIRSAKEWEMEKDIYLQLLELRIYSTFDMDIEAGQVLDFLEDVRKSESNIDIHKSIVKYIDKL
ncbi:MAG: GTP pyrophosphokinase [Cellulosilyticaceae bacterium]